jgi:hypothetical protein
LIYSGSGWGELDCAAAAVLVQDPTTGAEPVPAARWARCPVDGQLHLLAAAADVAAATAGAAYAALCGRRIPVGELTLRGSSQGLCVSCLAAGTAP